MLLLNQEPMLVQLPRVSWTESNNKPHQYLQKWRPSQFSNPGDKWPVRETDINSYTYIFHIGDNNFEEHFVVMKKFTGPIMGMHFMRDNNVIIDATRGLIHFPHPRRQVKNAAIQTSAKPQPVLIHDRTTVPPMTKKTITAFVDHPSERHTTGPVKPVRKFTEAVSLLMSQPISTIINKNTAVRITNTTKPPYPIKKNTQISEISVVTPEQFNFVKLVDTEFLSMIPETDRDLTTYLSGFLIANKPEQQNNTFSFPTPKNPGKAEDHTPTQTRILKKLHELQEKEKLTPKDDVGSRMKLQKQFDWTDILLTETEKHAAEKIFSRVA